MAGEIKPVFRMVGYVLTPRFTELGEWPEVRHRAERAEYELGRFNGADWAERINLREGFGVETILDYPEPVRNGGEKTGIFVSEVLIRVRGERCPFEQSEF